MDVDNQTQGVFGSHKIFLSRQVEGVFHYSESRCVCNGCGFDGRVSIWLRMVKAPDGEVQLRFEANLPLKTCTTGKGKLNPI